MPGVTDDFVPPLNESAFEEETDISPFETDSTRKRKLSVAVDEEEKHPTDHVRYWTDVLKKTEKKFGDANEELLDVEALKSMVPFMDLSDNPAADGIPREDVPDVPRKDVVQTLLNFEDEDSSDAIASATRLELRAALEQLKNIVINDGDKVKEVLYRFRCFELDKGIQLRDKDIQLRDKLRDKDIQLQVQQHVYDTRYRALGVSISLLFLCSLSEKVEVTQAQTTAAAKVEIEELANEMKIIESARRSEDSHVKQVNPNESRDSIVHNAESFDEFAPSELSVLFKNSHLSAVSEVYTSLFRNACFLNRSDASNRKTYDIALSRALKYLRDLAQEIRHGKMNKGKLDEFLEKIETENDSEMVDLVSTLRAIEKWLAGDKSGEKPPLNVPENCDPDIRQSAEQLFRDLDTNTQAKAKCAQLLNTLKSRLLWLPGPTAQENEGVQPLFVEVLKCVAECLPPAVQVHKNESANGHSTLSTPLSSVGESPTPLKGTIRSEVKVGRTNDRPGRRADFTIWVRGKHLVLMWDDTIELVIELKPGQRLISGPEELYVQCLNQGLSHAAKSLVPPLNLGPGVPAQCTFVVGSTVYARVFKLMLISPGTPKARVVLKQSEFFPLVPKDCFDRFYRSDQRHEANVEAFTKIVFNKDLTPDHAFKAFGKLMTSWREELVGMDKSVVPGHLLGNGTYGTVLATEDKNMVLKLSRYGRAAYLLDELAALQVLGAKKQGSSGSCNVTSLKGFGMVLYSSLLVASRLGYQDSCCLRKGAARTNTVATNSSKTYPLLQRACEVV